MPPPAAAPETLPSRVPDTRDTPLRRLGTGAQHNDAPHQKQPALTVAAFNSSI